MPLLSVHLRAPLSIQGGKRWGRTVFLPPNFIPRNSDLPRLKAASDWLMTRSACLICIKQLYGDGSDLLKGTGAHIKTWCSFIARLDMETMTSPDFIITRWRRIIVVGALFITFLTPLVTTYLHFTASQFSSLTVKDYKNG